MYPLRHTHTAVTSTAEKTRAAAAAGCTFHRVVQQGTRVRLLRTYEFVSDVQRLRNKKCQALLVYWGLEYWT